MFKAMNNFRFSVVIIYIWLLFISLPFSAGQEVPTTPDVESEAEFDEPDPYRISVAVSEVRLDVVALDDKGRQITDLTAADFEVYQDRLLQDVTSSIYIKNQTDAAASPAAYTKDASNLLKPSVPAQPLKEEVCRTIVFVVDNFSMTFRQLGSAKMSMKRFLERQMQPGDMVAIMRTSFGNSAIQVFLSDRRMITERIDHIPHVGPKEPDDCDLSDPYCPWDPRMYHHMYDNQLSTLSYSIRALSNMPGRKILLFLTAYPDILNPVDNFTTERADGGTEITIESERNKNYYEAYGDRYDRLADEAMKAGVVVHVLDTKGAEVGLDPKTGMLLPPPNLGAWNPLPAKTGGTIIAGSNFFLDGIGKEVNNMIAGYYLVSYIPPETTFQFSRKDIYHRMEVNVKRKGVKVYTRDGFYGSREKETDSQKPVNPLQSAIFSPFQHVGLDVNMTAGYTRDVIAGYLIRSWIHIDPKNVKIVETEDGGARIDIDTACMTSDSNGYIHDYQR